MNNIKIIGSVYIFLIWVMVTFAVLPFLVFPTFYTVADELMDYLFISLIGAVITFVLALIFKWMRWLRE